MAEVKRAAYRRAGVDVAAGEAAVERMRAAVEATHRFAPVLEGLGGFGAAVGLPEGYREPVLVAATDGVGTKTALAARLGRYGTIGRDLVAMCADDVVCSGAAPLLFLDYVAVGRLDPERVATIVGGIADGCREAGCALVGGETAEHPGLLEPDEFDLAGFCVGVVEASARIDGSGVRAGDAIVGVLTSGLHANGYSLVRAVLAEGGFDLGAPYLDVLRRVLGPTAAEAAVTADAAAEAGTEAGIDLAGQTLGDVLLRPTPIYARRLLAVRERLRASGFDLGGVAHITGGGLPGNVPRILPPGLGALLDPGRWPLPSVMRWLGATAGIDEPELRATVNGGLGLVVVVRRTAVEATIAAFAAEALAARLVGVVVEAGKLGDRRYLEAPLPAEAAAWAPVGEGRR
ncbi:MAG TPA: phosphoribosylformylglycinamidine cyclo-ligase [Candidatus Binatia bacterium]|nr:phosphoribosylformylglycinamidine cyclo-ligase [Candidatus Binatia bacterium]